MLSDTAEQILENYYLTPTSPAFTEHWTAGAGPSYHNALHELEEVGYIRVVGGPGVRKYRLTPAGYREARTLFGPAPARAYGEGTRRRGLKKGHYFQERRKD